MKKFIITCLIILTTTSAFARIPIGPSPLPPRPEFVYSKGYHDGERDYREKAIKATVATAVIALGVYLIIKVADTTPSYNIPGHATITRF